MDSSGLESDLVCQTVLYKCPFCATSLEKLELKKHIQHSHPGLTVSHEDRGGRPKTQAKVGGNEIEAEDGSKGNSEASCVPMETKRQIGQFLFTNLIDLNEIDLITEEQANLIALRMKFAYEINPSQRLTKILENVLPFNEKYLVPRVKDITREQVKSVLKGMSIGIMYNMDHEFVRNVILRELDLASQGFYCCPFCQGGFPTQVKLSDHISLYHTSFTAFCTVCRSIWLTSDYVNHPNHAIDPFEPVSDDELHSEGKNVDVSDGKQSKDGVNGSQTHKEEAADGHVSCADANDSEIMIIEEISRSDHSYSECDSSGTCGGSVEKSSGKTVREGGNSKEEKQFDENPRGLETKRLLDHYVFLPSYDGRNFEDMTPSQKKILTSRQEYADKLNPDPDLVKSLVGIKPFEFNYLVPMAHDITSDQVKEVLKGMIRGFFYNIDFDTLRRKILVDRVKKQLEDYSCPFCQEIFGTLITTIKHISDKHTGFAAHCRLCGRTSFSSVSFRRHVCPGTKGSNKSYSDGDEVNNGSTIKQLESLFKPGQPEEVSTCENVYYNQVAKPEDESRSFSPSEETKLKESIMKGAVDLISRISSPETIDLESELREESEVQSIDVSSSKSSGFEASKESENEKSVTGPSNAEDQSQEGVEVSKDLDPKRSVLCVKMDQSYDCEPVENDDGDKLLNTDSVEPSDEFKIEHFAVMFDDSNCLDFSIGQVLSAIEQFDSEKFDILITEDSNEIFTDFDSTQPGESLISADFNHGPILQPEAGEGTWDSDLVHSNELGVQTPPQTPPLDDKETQFFAKKRSHDFDDLVERVNKKKLVVRLERIDVDKYLGAPAKRSDQRPIISSRILMGKFIQRAVPQFDYRKQDDCVSAERKKMMSMVVSPDWSVFKDLEETVAWSPVDLVPTVVDLTDEESLRLLKGMSQGTLYNIDFSVLQRIFLSRLVPHAVRNPSSGEFQSLYYCPLCRLFFKHVNEVLGHLEVLHTNFVVQCLKCQDHLLTWGDCCSHRCPINPI